jgi:protease I
MAYLLMIIPPKEFKDEEFFDTKEILEDHGHDITTASTHEGSCLGVRGGIVDAEIALSDVRVKDYDGVIFIGEIGAMMFFFDRVVQNIILDARLKNKLIGAIGYAPVVLANSGVLDGIRATVDSSKIDDIEDQGAIYTEEAVTEDQGIITADNARHTKKFATKMNEYFELHEQMA